jgi:hypothetical protein
MHLIPLARDRHSICNSRPIGIELGLTLTGCCGLANHGAELASTGYDLQNKRTRKTSVYTRTPDRSRPAPLDGQVNSEDNSEYSRR